MKRKILCGSLLIAAIALIVSAPVPYASGQAAKTRAGAGQLITVLNPAVSKKMAERIPLCPRPGTLEGKTIYLVDLQWGGPEAAYSVFEEMQGWLAQNMPSVKLSMVRSANSWI